MWRELNLEPLPLSSTRRVPLPTALMRHAFQLLRTPMNWYLIICSHLLLGKECYAARFRHSCRKTIIHGQGFLAKIHPTLTIFGQIARAIWHAIMKGIQRPKFIFQEPDWKIRWIMTDYFLRTVLSDEKVHWFYYQSSFDHRVSKNFFFNAIFTKNCVIPW